MGRPIWPSPMKPIVAILPSWTPGLRRRASRTAARPPAAAPCTAATSAASTSPRPAWRQRGRRSLSISSARTPSTKSLPDSTRCTIRYSKRNASSIDSSRPRRSCAKVSARERMAIFRLSSRCWEAPKPPGSAFRCSSTPARSPRRSSDRSPAQGAQRTVRGQLMSGPAVGNGLMRIHRLGTCDQRALDFRPAGLTAPRASPRPRPRSRHRSAWHRSGPDTCPPLARAARQEPGPADVREEANAGLRHRELGTFGGDPEVAMNRDPDATASR